VLDLRPIFLVIGILLIILAVFMAPPMVADMAVGHPDWQGMKATWDSLPPSDPDWVL